MSNRYFQLSPAVGQSLMSIPVCRYKVKTQYRSPPVIRTPIHAILSNNSVIIVSSVTGSITCMCGTFCQKGVLSRECPLREGPLYSAILSYNYPGNKTTPEIRPPQNHENYTNFGHGACSILDTVKGEMHAFAQVRGNFSLLLLNMLKW